MEQAPSVEPRLGDRRARVRFAMEPVRFECGCRVFGGPFVVLEQWIATPHGRQWVTVGGHPRHPCIEVSPS